MTYAQKYGRYGIYMASTLYRWFKDLEKAEAFWSENIVGEDNACAEEWLEEYDNITLVDMKYGEILRRLNEEV